MLNRKKILTHLTSSFFGRNLFCHPEIDSTNKLALQMAKEGAPEGSVVCAGFQTVGKGRLERSWHSEKGKNMLLSLILRPKAEVEYVQRITLATALILKDYIQSFTKRSGLKTPEIDVKWPNDLLINNKKIAGILTQSILKEKEVDALIIGIGLNLNEELSSFPPELQQKATSLIEETGTSFNLNRFISGFLSFFEESYLKLERTNYQEVVAMWKDNCNQLGKKIEVSLPTGEKQIAKFLDISDSGYLIYKLEDGSSHKLTAGEITVL